MKKLVCVICGIPWTLIANACPNPDCAGFCSWGEKKDGDPSSWEKIDDRWVPKMPTKFNIADYLDDKEIVAEYLTTVIENGDSKDLVIAIGHIAKAIGMSKNATKIKN